MNNLFYSTTLLKSMQPWINIRNNNNVNRLPINTYPLLFNTGNNRPSAQFKFYSKYLASKLYKSIFMNLVRVIANPGNNSSTNNNNNINNNNVINYNVI